MKGNLKAASSFVLAIIILAGILIAPVNAGSNTPEMADSVSSGLPSSGILPPVDCTSLPTVVFRPASPLAPAETVEKVTLTASVSGQGSIIPGLGVLTFVKGSTVQLNPQPDAGWKFSGWQGDTLDAANQIYMDGNKNVKAVFTLIPVVDPSTLVTIPAEESPAAPAEGVSEPIVMILDEDVPAAPVAPVASVPMAELPQTGGIPAGVFYGFGGLAATAGLILRMKLKKIDA